MRKDKKIALGLRRLGKSYNDISKQLYIPKSTLSNWFSNIQWSSTIKNDLNKSASVVSTNRIRDLSHDRGEKLKSLYKQAETEAREEYMVLKHDPLFVSVIMLYWGEGDKANRNRCSLSNSDPNMLRLFTLFLEKICGVEKQRIKAWILAYPNVDQIKALEFWSKSVAIWPTNFFKTIVIQGGSQKRTLPFGVCYVTVSSSYLKRKIVMWIKLLSDDLIKMRV